MIPNENSMHDDPIAAIATPPGTGALATLRLSGSGSLALATKVLGPRLAASSPRNLVRVIACDAEGREIDDGLAAWFAAPASFTGEESVEFTGHGGMLVARLVLDAFFAAGARPAGPGEFSQRAFLNGRLDLTAAEAVMDLIHAHTELGLRAARSQMGGALREESDSLRGHLIETLAHIEAWIDFPEEDISPDTGAALAARVRDAIARTDFLLSTAERGRILRDGLRLVIAGEPNAGKSSLLNLLLGFDRAIVSEQPGTTRDTVEELVNLGGVPVRLIDTAGLRDAADVLEQSGIHRTRQAMERADLVLELADATLPPEKIHRVPLPDGLPHHLLVLNKADLGEHPDWKTTAPDAPRLSCATREGLDALVAAITRATATTPSSFEAHPVAINQRHQHALTAARSALEAAAGLIASGAPPELTAEELRSALDHIGLITGRADIEEILDSLFSQFCIGK